MCRRKVLDTCEFTGMGLGTPVVEEHGLLAAETRLKTGEGSGVHNGHLSFGSHQENFPVIKFE